MVPSPFSAVVDAHERRRTLQSQWRSRFGLRTRFCNKGLRAWRSLAVGQRGGVAECLADRRELARGLSLRASRDLAPRKVSGS